jgi:hypothetical protein
VGSFFISVGTTTGFTTGLICGLGLMGSGFGGSGGGGGGGACCTSSTTKVSCLGASMAKLGSTSAIKACSINEPIKAHRKVGWLESLGWVFSLFRVKFKSSVRSNLN